MPESPEVSALVAFLDRSLVGCIIAQVDVLESRAWKSRDRPAAALVGATVLGARRYGKHIAITTDRGCVVISLGRAGWVRWIPSGTPEAGEGSDPAPAIVRVGLDDADAFEVTDAGDWLSVGVTVADDPLDVPMIARLGPDPLEPGYDFEDLDRALGSRRKQLKALLQEQESIAGIGSAYSDEILHAARLSPRVQAVALDGSARHRLFDAVREVLGGAAADRLGVPIDRQKAAKTASMRVHGRSGEPCPVCSATVADVPGSQGRAQYCPVCQAGGSPLGGAGASAPG